MTDEEAQGGRIFFSSTGRSLVDEDELVVLSVGVDIGSSTSHLVFSRIVLERLDSRYVVTIRETFYQSDILLTPYAAEEEIDATALGAFIERQYQDAKVDPDEIDTGALILTGVAVRRRNARKIGELFARQAGKMVAVSAGDSLETVMAAGSPAAGGRALLRLDPLSQRRALQQLTFSGGVAEYIYGREAQAYGDLGVLLAQEIRARVEGWGPKLERASEGIRATVIGASQYTTQVSGSTIYVAPLEALPLRNVPVIAPAFALDHDEIDSAAVAAEIKALLKRLDLSEAGTPVAVFVPWRGSATFQRLDAFCQGLTDGLAAILVDGHPLVLAGDGDVGGLMGIHLCEEMQLDNAIVSVDGLELKEFDYIDIGTMLPNSGAVPVVIKSLIFPASAAPGMEWQPAPRIVGEHA